MVRVGESEDFYLLLMQVISTAVYHKIKKFHFFGGIRLLKSIA